MTVSASHGWVKAAWTGIRAETTHMLPPGAQDRFDDVLLDLLHTAAPGPAMRDPDTSREQEALLTIGISAARELANHAQTDPELLAAVVALPWCDPALLRSRSPLAARPGALTWPAAMVLAMASPESPRLDPTGETGGPHYLRHAACLPPLLRAAIILVRHLAMKASRASPIPLFPSRPFGPDELSMLATDIPAGLLPAADSRADSPVATPAVPAPVGSSAEAVSLIPTEQFPQFGSYRMSVDGDPGYVTTAEELIYVVRWDVPVEAIRRHDPPITFPGDQYPVAYREPAWIVDRVTHEVDRVDTSIVTPAEYAAARRNYPLPPGWQLGERPPIAEGVALDLARLLPPAALPALSPLLREITSRYAAALSDQTWPDYLIAWRIARHAIWTLAGTGLTDPTVLGAALLTARGMATDDTLADDACESWQTDMGSVARAARSAEDEQYGPGLSRRVSRLADAPAAVRAVVLADARARASVETDLFGVTPQARRAELAELSALVADLPALRHLPVADEASGPAPSHRSVAEHPSS